MILRCMSLSRVAVKAFAGWLAGGIVLLPVSTLERSEQMETCIRSTHT